jgi:hypothetical protein
MMETGYNEKDSGMMEGENIVRGDGRETPVREVIPR